MRKVVWLLTNEQLTLGAHRELFMDDISYGAGQSDQNTGNSLSMLGCNMSCAGTVPLSLITMVTVVLVINKHSVTRLCHL